MNLPRFARPTAVLFAFLVGTSAAQAAWDHASAPGGQYEGTAAGDGLRIEYGCTGFSARLRIAVPGDHAGPARVKVDGQEITTVALTHRPTLKASTIDLDADTPAAKAALNRVIDALAGGREMTVVTADGQAGTLSLSGSAPIRNCRAQ
ncbi:hypothetical protein [Falsirhodobacter halotolerans]|uniref:hypothetical protein n=1 Tax=Falsirhodobacter halotolerans TaxID=1146892 RepID=UPI001FD0DFDC|nr:hypothetical protein [Falsirhodobacter halotolerans]MCJ8139940.1 hypothetical protein [Falsirhodobacter halotolerans]